MNRHRIFHRRTPAALALLPALVAACAHYAPPSSFHALKDRYSDPAVIGAGEQRMEIQAFLGISRPAPAAGAAPGAVPAIEAVVTLVVVNPFNEPATIDPRKAGLRDDEDRSYAPRGDGPQEIVVSARVATRVVWTFTLDPTAPPDDLASMRFTWNLKRGGKETSIETKFVRERVIYLERPYAPAYY